MAGDDRFTPQGTVFHQRVNERGLSLIYTGYCPYCSQRDREEQGHSLCWSPTVGVMHCFGCGRGAKMAPIKMRRPYPMVVVRPIEL